MAADPLDCRDRVQAAKQGRIAQRQSLHPEAVRGGRNPLSGAALPVNYGGGGLCPLPAVVISPRQGDGRLNSPIGCIFAPGFLHPLRSQKAEQGQRNKALPAKRATRLHRDAQHFGID